MKKVNPSWITGWQETSIGKISKVSTKLKVRDLLGFWRIRWRIRRMDYKVEPGLYAIGNPSSGSPVLASANYKMSFDILRRAVAGYNLWIMVLDTRGINVWCAAGKGTFSAEEILHRIEVTNLDKILSKKVIILPQLCATGVRAYELQKRSGFQVIYGPVRAGDIPLFLDRGMKATTEMRRVKFSFVDRLVLTPGEFIWSLKWVAIILAILFILGGFNRFGFSLFQVLKVAPSGFVAILGAVIAGTVITPVFLPWIPGRAFSLKGYQVGLFWALALIVYRWQFMIPGNSPNIAEIIAILLLIPAISAFFALIFTGTSTYTSASGVRKELRFALPAIIGSVIIGSSLFVTSLIMALI